MKQQEDSTSELRFPVGMQVLVVDDDMMCLKLMDSLLRKCQYYVTTTNRGQEALKILKNNPNMYDIVISDVEMPDMDGIKLLQLISLEMNIPVIMLSAYSETKRVMQGIRNGACDYLVKPVRIQELQNIWQHVVRRNKNITMRKPLHSPSIQINVRAERLKGKSLEDNSSGGDDFHDDDDDEHEDSGQDNEESTNQKKPRLFWSVELHQKFVDAVNTLGIDKAFPKKILDLMNVEGLTREKVASHLQKYRIFLKKVNSGSNETGNKISAYDDVHIGPLGGGYGVFRSLAGATGRYSGINPSLSHPPIFGRLNTESGLSIRGLASSPVLQTAQLPNSSTSLTPFGKFEPETQSLNQNATLFQGFPSLPQNKASFLYPTPITSEFGNQSSSNIGPLDGISNLLDPNACPPNWGSSVHSSIPPQAFQQNLFTSNASAAGTAPPTARMQNVQNDPLEYLCGFSSVDSLKGNSHIQDRFNVNGVSNLSSLGQSEIWQGQRPDYLLDSCNMTAASSSLTPAVTPVDQILRQNNTNISSSPFSLLEGTSQFVQQPKVEQNMKFDDFLLDEPKVAGGVGDGSSEYLEDIVGRFLKQENGETAATEDDFGLDPFSI